MKRFIYGAVTAVLLGSFAGTASAHDQFSFSLGIGGFPFYAAPVPVYVAAPPIYVRPAPVYFGSPSVYVGPRVVYRYYDNDGYYNPRYYRDRGWHRGWDRHHDDDDD